MAIAMILAGGVLAAFLSTCAPGVAPDTMRAIVGVESGGNPLALNDNTTRRSYAPRDRVTALAIARVLLARGDSVDVGLAQINSVNFRAYGVDASTMLEPCRNLSVASRILSADYTWAFTSYPTPQLALWHAISAYNTGSLFAGKPYVDAVVAQAFRAPTVPTIQLLAGASNADVLPFPQLNTASPVVRESHHPSVSVTRPRARTHPADAPLGVALRTAGIDRSLTRSIVHGPP